jgi:hypothetical protein
VIHGVREFGNRQMDCRNRGGVWLAPRLQYPSSHPLLGRSEIGYGPNNCGERRIGIINTRPGGIAPSGFTPYAAILVAVSTPYSVTFTGSGYNMIFSSGHFVQFADADFWLFVYNARNDEIVDQMDLGLPTGKSFVTLSPFQNGFVMREYGSGAGGYVLQLAYTYDASSALSRRLAVRTIK